MSAIPGTDAYWAEMKEAFALIRRLRDALYDAECEGDLFHGYDEENFTLPLWDHAQKLMCRICRNRRTTQILRGMGMSTFTNGAILNRTAHNISYRDLDGV